MRIDVGTTKAPDDSRPTLPGERVYYCRDCGEFIHSTGDDPRRCPTPGCRRPNGFGRHTDDQRP